MLRSAIAHISAFLFSTITLIFVCACKNDSESETIQPYQQCNQSKTNSDAIVFSDIRISETELRAIGYRIYINECSGRAENLTYWNRKESFPSMGIGHFIWYSTNYDRFLGDSFSKMLIFYEQSGIKLPDWIKKTNYKCPWVTREAFYRDFNSSKMQSLRELLKNTMYLQARFIVMRFKGATDRIFNAPGSPQSRQHIQYQFYRVAKSPMGLYALIDYANFKGAGTMNSGNWGLLQVLENMKGNEIGRQALIDFVNSAKLVLKNRTIQSKDKSFEERHINGWYKRLDTYCL